MMKNIILILSFLVGSPPLWAANLYVDSTCAAGAAYDKSSRTQGAGSDVSYQTIQAAVNAMSGGDDIYVRGGTYDEQVTIVGQTKDGTAGNHSSLQSYPGEWAIIHPTSIPGGEYAVGYIIRYGAPQNQFNHWTFERLGITCQVSQHGLCLGGSDILVRYCYFYEIYRTTSHGDNPSAIYAGPLRDSVIEYNYFYNNGYDADGTYELHSANGMNFESDYAETTEHGMDLTKNIESNPGQSVTNFRGRNIIRYNLSVHTSAESNHGIYHDKAHQFLDTYIPVIQPSNSAYKTWGTVIHHNISLGTRTSISAMTDFDQIYNNIVDGRIEIQDAAYTVFQNGPVVYNNTIFNSGARGRILYHGGGVNGTEGVEGLYPGYMYAYNNLLDNPTTGDQEKYFGVGNGYMITGFDRWSWDKFKADRNYIYRPTDTSTPVRILRDEAACTGTMSVADLNSCGGGTNWYKASSEGSDNLFSGESGADQYITRGDHVISGTATIANGGYNAAHPYLSGVTIPRYVGAVNPSDSDWVAGTLGLATDSNEDGIPDNLLSATAGSDPSWIEGSGSSPSTPSIRNGGIRNGGLRP